MAQEDGDYVRANDPLLTLETDKVSTELAAEASGKISIQVKEGEEVTIGQVVASIDESAAARAPRPAPNKVAPAPKVARPANRCEQSGQSESRGQGRLRRAVVSGGPADHEEEKISPAQIAGTGKGGGSQREM